MPPAPIRSMTPRRRGSASSTATEQPPLAAEQSSRLKCVVPSTKVLRKKRKFSAVVVAAAMVGDDEEEQELYKVRPRSDSAGRQNCGTSTFIQRITTERSRRPCSPLYWCNISIKNMRCAVLR